MDDRLDIRTCPEGLLLPYMVMATVVNMVWQWLQLARLAVAIRFGFLV